MLDESAESIRWAGRSNGTGILVKVSRITWKDCHEEIYKHTNPTNNITQKPDFFSFFFCTLYCYEIKDIVFRKTNRNIKKGMVNGMNIVL